jgi:hypothetical protein
MANENTFPKRIFLICIVFRVSLFLNFWTFSNIYIITFRMHRFQDISCNRIKRKKSKGLLSEISKLRICGSEFLSLHNAFFTVSTREYACRIFSVNGTIQMKVTATFVSCRYQNFEPCTCRWMSLLAPVSDLADTSAVHTCRNLAGSHTQGARDGFRNAAVDGWFAGAGYSMLNKSSNIFSTRSRKRKLYKVHCLLHNHFSNTQLFCLPR